ncbi:hypothetical protein T4A_9337 [Trichinella pseudospiralis]|uniref:Uncharacterized protein n=1 Tax=Trichinella pseudospiralis TaxID=6337 RepID=A0A0V1DQ08_TRIPS|nr:hypothetical protein T4A_9337 [Trichinella pseudospiralis]
MSSAKWQTCPEWDLKYLKQVEDGETKNGPLPGAARFPTLERGKPRLSALKRWVRLNCFTCLRCAGSLVFFPCSQVKRTLPDPGAGKA